MDVQVAPEATVGDTVIDCMAKLSQYGPAGVIVGCVKELTEMLILLVDGHKFVVGEEFVL